MDASSFSSVVRAKLKHPPLPEDYIARPRLLEQISHARLRPLTVLSAPAGYGKTTLLAAWLEQSEIHSAWISLDEDNNDLGSFLIYFIAAIQGIFPEFGKEVQAVLAMPALPPLQVIAQALLNEIDQIDLDFVLVLDDYHTITEADVHSLIAKLLRHPHRTMHLVLASRYDPPLPLINLRARGHMTEMRAQDLRFSKLETALFIRQTLETTLDEPSIDLLDGVLEGWPAGLRLTSLSLRYNPDIGVSLAGMQVSNRYVMEYLVNEVLERLTPDVQAFLLKTSILNRFNAPICDALIGTTGKSQSILEWLEDSNLFLIPLDEQRGSYRYHRLFREFLQNRLFNNYEPEEVTALHNQASDWYARHGMMDDAIDQALFAGDFRSAANLVFQDAPRLMALEQWNQYRVRLDKFSRQVYDECPQLLLLESWYRIVQYQHANAYSLLERYRSLAGALSLSEEESRRFQAFEDCIKAIQSTYERNPQQAIFYSRRVLDSATPELSYLRTFAYMHLAIGYQSMGEFRQARTVIDEGQLEDDHYSHRPTGLAAIGGCFVFWMAADLRSLKQLASRMIEIAEKYNTLQSLSMGRYFLGTVYYQHNDLALAEAAFTEVVRLPYLAHPVAFLGSALALARIYQIQEMGERANELVQKAISFCMDAANPTLIAMCRSSVAELALHMGDLEAASSWAAQVGPDLLLKPIPLPLLPDLVLPKVLLAQATPASLAQAAQIIPKMLDYVTSFHNIRFQIELLAMQSLLLNALGDEKAALQSLERSIELAEPGAFIRIFIDLGQDLGQNSGQAMAQLLDKLFRNGIAPGYIAKILKAFPTRELPSTVFKSSEIVEILTERELEILALLSQRLSNKEIAQELVISPITVKRHTINIYQKLNINSRREAVARAIELGILEP